MNVRTAEEKEIVHLECGVDVTAALYSDGTVRVIGILSRHLVGGKSDGTVVAAGPWDSKKIRVVDLEP